MSAHLYDGNIAAVTVLSTCAVLQSHLFLEQFLLEAWSETVNNVVKTGEVRHKNHSSSE